jgi:hypothetical protein
MLAMKLPAAHVLGWFGLVGLTLGASSLPAHAADYYVAVDGNDANAGNLGQPFASIKRAEMAATAGDTVYVRGGVYRFSGSTASVGVAFTKSGSAGKPIRYFAYQGETPIIDLFELKPQARVTGLDIRANWLHLRGFEVRGTRQIVVGDSWSVRIRGDNNIVEQLNVHDGQAPGIFISSGASNLILNCDSHHNYDPLEQGGNADGFGCHSSGGNNVLRGCRAFENSDDGFDFINAPGTCIAEGSWAFRNGYIPDTNNAGANGAGFKSGGFGEPPNTPASGAPRHTIRNCVAFGNRAIGIYANHHPGGIDFFNNTSFDNPANFDMRPATGGTTSHKLRNNVSAGTGKAIVNFNGGSDEINSWTLQVQVTSADFVSMDKQLARAPRLADGSLPSGTLVRLAENSDLIDRGQDVGLPFSGKAPDLGAYEWGAAPASDAGVVDAGSGAADAGESADAASQPRSDAGVPSAADAGSTQTGSADADVGQAPDRSDAAATTANTDAGGAAAAPGGARAPAQDQDDDDDAGCSLTRADDVSARAAWLLACAGLLLARRRRRRTAL